jgi:hypothetical protein
MQDEKPTFTQEDLAVLGAEEALEVKDGEADDATTSTTDDAAGKGAEAGKGAKTVAGGDEGADDKAVGAEGKKTIATGGDVNAEDKAKQEAADKAHKPYWPEDWRQKAAEHLVAGDKKVLAKELKRLERITDPAALAGMYRELEGKFSAGGLVKIPGKDAKPEEVTAFAKALGWTEKPEELMGAIKLESGAVLGDTDKPLVSSFLQAVNGATTAQDFVNKAVNWNLKQQEEAAAALDEADDTYRRESEAALKEEFGPAFKRKTNAISSLFATAPGGVDVKNDKSLYARLMGGRTADGKLIGNDPDMVRFLVSLASEVNPAATVVEDGNQTGLSIDAELKAIDKARRENRPAYNKDYAMQARERELIEAQQKIQSRQRA